MARVALIKGEGRRENIRRSLALISGEVRKNIGTRKVIVKPNFVSTSIHLAATHVDHIRAILDCLTGFYKGKVIVAESAAGNTLDGFRNFGYYSLCEEYDVELVDLNQGSFRKVTLENAEGMSFQVRVAEALISPEYYRISAAKLKTHDAVVVTLSVKNMAMGSVHVIDKTKVHQGTRHVNLNIARLARHVWPDLAVIDGFLGMEGEGPSFGSPVRAGVAISGTDPLAADRVACSIMGVDASRVGYLYHCASAGLGEFDIEKIEIDGTPLKECIRPFRLHSRVEEQYQWR